MAASGSGYMESPLVIWVDTFRQSGSKPLKYPDLYNGVFLCDVMQQIDPRPAYQNVNRNVKDMNVRFHNWDLLIKNIKAYYLDVLQQLLVMKLPNIHSICKEPEKESAFSEIRKALLLILGCAVQCERKEQFIEKIMRLDVEVQHVIMENIKEVTDDSETILPLEQPEELEQYTDKMLNHVTRLIKERDDYSEAVTELTQERDYFQAQLDGKPTPPSPTTSPEKHHMGVELADCKARLRKLRQELEEKQEQISDLRDEVEEQKAVQAKLRKENMEMTPDARSARSLRDELDVLREEVNKVRNYESEILKYKEKLNELEFYKARVDEVREDNAILIETKSMLEEQLANSHKRVETVIELEQELVKYRQQVEDLSSERDADRERIKVLAEENAQLQFQKKSSMNESTNLEQELEATKARIAGLNGGTLSDQLKETTNAKILRLELENHRLHQKLEDMRESSLIENTTLNLQLEKENQRLSKKVEKLQEASKDTSQKCIDLEEEKQRALHECSQLKQAFDLTKESAERQVRELEREHEHLTQTIETLRERNEQTNDTKLKDLERENKRLHQTLSVKNQQVSKFEFENRQLQKTYHKSKQNADRISELETENSSLERENSDLQKTVQTLQLTCDKYEKLEQENSDLEVDNKKLQRTVQSLQSALHKKEQLEQDHINLKVENQKLQRTIESLKDSSSRVLEVENERDLMNRDLQQVRRSLESYKSQRVKLEKMELDLMDLDNENMKLQKSLEITTNRVHQLEKDNGDLENENEKLQETIESMKYSNKRLVELEKENSELEQECRKFQKEKSALEKDVKRYKVSIDSKESAIDDLTSKYSALDKENKNLHRMLDRQKDTSANVKEMEKENRDLIHAAVRNEKTINTLREDLVNEKVKTQQMNNELEKLGQELERVGISKEKLVTSSQAPDDSRYKALENMMEEALKKNLEIKEEKIQALESRLGESKNRNLKLQEELRILRRECESLKQRYEEESHGRDRHESVPLKNSRYPLTQSNPTKDILELKDHLVKVERNNATLMAENGNLKSQTNSLNEQIKKLESQNNQMHSHNSSIQQQNSSLQSQNAKLQVENSTLQSQGASLLGQNTQLQSQYDNLSSDHKKLCNQYDDLQHAQEQLIQDHNSLQSLHEQLNSEYEGLISELGGLKALHKSLKNENKDLKEQLNQLSHGNDDIQKLREVLEREKDQLKSELKSLGNLQMDYNRLRDQHDHVLGAKDKLEKDYKDLLGESKRIKTDYNSLQLQHTDMQGRFQDCKEQFTNMELNYAKLASKYEALYQLSQRYEEDNSKLLEQVQQLLSNNQDLLVKMLNSKESYVEEQKEYMERLSDLKRQKERLEEKIMDHYKNKEKQKKHRTLGAVLAQKARSLLSKSQRSKSQRNLADGSLDSSNLGDSVDGESGRKSDKPRRLRRRGSVEQNQGSPHLGKQNKGLARSTTALNALRDSQVDLSFSDFRGARSTEDLLSDTLRSQGDVSQSLSNSTFLLPGMGRPASDDEGGFKSGLTSPTTDMLTLEEFLAEGLDSPPLSRKKFGRQEDSESRSSGNSDHSGRRNQRKPAPLPPGTQLNNTRKMTSIPDVAAVSQSNSNLSVSRISHVSTESSGSSQDVRPDNYNHILTSPPSSMQHPDTSTPARAQSQFRVKSYEEMNSYSPLPRSQSADDQRNVPSAFDTPPSSSSTRQFQYNNDPSSHRQSLDQRQSHDPGGRLSHDPGYPPRSPITRDSITPERENLPPDARLDLLTRGGGGVHNQPFSPNSSSNSGGWSPASNFSSPRDRSWNEPDTTRSDQSRVDRTPQQNWGRVSAGPRPMKATTPTADHYTRNHSPGRSLPPTGQSTSDRTTSQGGRKTILVSRANMGPTPYGQKSVNMSPSRPASAFGAPVQSVQRDNAGMNNARQGPNSSASEHAPSLSVSNSSEQNGPVMMRDNYSRANRMERPKSVPPTMFNRSDDEGIGDTSNYNSHQGGKGPPPVPPPRKNRDAVQRYSVLREPNANTNNTRPLSSTGNFSSRGSVSSSQSNMNNGVYPSSSGGQRSQTPTSRLLPQSKAPQNKAPVPKPMPQEENKDPKENSVWYEYGCV